MKKSKKKIVKVLDKTPANDPKGGGHHGAPPQRPNRGGHPVEQGHHMRFNPR